MKTLYVRVQPRTGANSFYRCAIKFGQAWQKVEVDDATAKRLAAEQMLEVTENQPEGFEDTEAGDSAGNTSTTAEPVTPASALKPTEVEALNAAIVAAVANMDKDNGELWTASGKPQLAAIEALTGWAVTAAERDAALASVKES